ncbi:sugar phosphate isomerase/epimerase family protein [Reyranella sp.]|uniref:sugar phosphate isomerase/epimerase family protein n=1 Tax=Reyranella sp. TaxID=1929291 RepID=UPI003D0A0317
MPDPFCGLALHTWTVDTTPLEEALIAAKAGGFDAVELRRVDFDRCAKRGLSNEAVLDLVRAAGLPVSAMGVEYGWIFSTGAERERLLGVFRECCENAVALRCGMMMSAIGPGSATTDEAVANIRRAGEIAGSFGLRLTLEYQFQHPVVRSLDILRDLIVHASASNVGLLLDAYHLQRGGRPGRGFEDVPGAEIFYVQFSDVPDAPPPGLPPVDRLPPGQGVVDWTGLFGLLAEKGYDSWLSYEAPNPAHWQQPATETAKQGAAATRRALARTFP